jgi:hypothetical protein
MGWNLHSQEMILACGIIVIASAAALVPIALARQATQLGMSQAALVATMAQMFIGVGLAAVIVLGKVHVDQTTFFAWLMAFYFASLIGLVLVACRAIRSAPMAVENKR